MRECVLFQGRKCIQLGLQLVLEFAVFTRQGRLLFFEPGELLQFFLMFGFCLLEGFFALAGLRLGLFVLAVQLLIAGLQILFAGFQRGEGVLFL